jgi:hypothetical protein
VSPRPAADGRRPARVKKLRPKYARKSRYVERMRQPCRTIHTKA